MVLQTPWQALFTPRTDSESRPIGSNHGSAYTAMMIDWCLSDRPAAEYIGDVAGGRDAQELAMPSVVRT